MRTNGRVGVRIAFTLPRREQIRLTLRGPAPSCRTAGTVRFSGVRGANRFDFLGRIRNKAVRSGVYVLTLASASSQVPVAAPLLVQIVNLGERSGKLEEMLLHASDAFDRQVRNSIKIFTALLPPILLIIMAIIGGFILAAILLPLLELQNMIG